eukprot:gene18171-21648_t
MAHGVATCRFLHVFVGVLLLLRGTTCSVGIVETIAGGGDERSSPEAGYLDAHATSARFDSPRGVVDSGSGYLYVTDSNNHKIRQVNIINGEVTTLAGAPDKSRCSENTWPVPSVDEVNPCSNDVPDNCVSNCEYTGYEGYVDGEGDVARFNTPSSAAWVPTTVETSFSRNGILYVADTVNRKIRSLVLVERARTISENSTTAAGVTVSVSTVAGSDSAGEADGTGKLASFTSPNGVAVNPGGTLAYVMDGVLVRQVSLPAGDMLQPECTPVWLSSTTVAEQLTSPQLQLGHKGPAPCATYMSMNPTDYLLA